MLIVLASSHDAGAASLVRRWRPHGARLLTCADLSRSGWRWEPGASDRATYVVAGEPVPARIVRGVVSLLPGVGPAELPHIVADEREYVASEMTAFLVAWLSSLPCRLINQPTPLCLTGPRLARERWLQHAAGVGLPILPSVRRLRPVASHQSDDPSPPLYRETPVCNGERELSVPVVAGTCMMSGSGEPPPTRFLAGVGRLAAVTGAGLLTITVLQEQTDWRFVDAAPIVDATRSDVADAMLHALGVCP